jgi:thiol-disulfide isomerase/thioredoxin
MPDQAARMNQKTRIYLLLFSLCANYCFPQNVIIRGLTHYMHNGKEIVVYGYDDLVTMTKVKLATDTIDAKGAFELGFNIDYPSKVEVHVGNLVGNMHVVPKYYYGITYPEPDSLYDLSPSAEYPVELGFIIKNKADTNEMNSLIIDFNRQWRRFFVENYQYFVMGKGVDKRLDTFQVFCNKRYKNVKEDYFAPWLKYALATLNTNYGRNPIWLADRYLVNKPVLYEEYEYMNFFNAYFKGYLYAMSTTKKGSEIIDVINENANYDLLIEVLKRDPALQNDSLRELVAIKGLYELYFFPKFKKENVLQMIEQVGRKTSNVYHKKIISNVLKNIYKLIPGSDAPGFTLLNKKGEKVSLKDFRGKYVYLDFMASWCGPCLAEMKEIADLKKKYGDKVIFISISLDEKIEDFKKFCDKNPKYDWVMLHFGADKSVKDRYYVKALPTYYFINQEGKLILSPAITPSEGFELKLKEMFSPKDKKKEKGPIKDN